ncbi:sphingomyelin phosphodiesterase 3-like [Scleropages formosus]|uniref:sphingomyelin phosphodiesterase n=1 Tax=Scleropages formosus TaxID=113540 RepID=A0A0P7V6B6_SCLFO|nr:sphingomyelin phosphodiesterase 5-like [Scleropages formosus]KPP77413.1 sphingomyelin phosphodiesterase 3-like [Scleropages formosus]
MALRESPFPNGFAEGLHAVGWGLIMPCFWFLDRLLAVCHSTSLEWRQRREEECYLHPLRVFFGVLFLLALFIISTPIAFLGFLLWAPLQAVRRPFSYHQERVVHPEAQECSQSWLHNGGKATFSFVAGNVCLLPDGLARFNNLGHSQRRAAAIGQLIAQGISRPHISIFADTPSSSGTLSPTNSLLSQHLPGSYGAMDSYMQSPLANCSSEGCVDGTVAWTGSGDTTGSVPDENKQGPTLPSCDVPPSGTKCSLKSNQHSSREQGHAPRAFRVQDQHDDVRCEVSTLFPPNVDIVCLEEVFDKRAAHRLKEALSTILGHVLYDVGAYAFQPHGCCSFKFFNSGLFVASRYPILEAEYHCYPNGRGEDALAAKGLLSVKVFIGLTQRQKPVIGYFNCTHLHAPEGEGEIRCEQLNLLMKWIEEFQTRTKEADEVVVFDVLCGDFNFDNCSPDDVLEQSHHVFQYYRDPCRAAQGKEKPWVIGTLLEQPTLYHEDVSTPERLQKTLETEELRKQYISPPVPLDESSMVYPDSGSPWVGRRIDYILYRESTLAKHCYSEVEEFTFVTQLAGLTDHIPVGLRMNVTLNSDSTDL